MFFPSIIYTQNNFLRTKYFILEDGLSQVSVIDNLRDSSRFFRLRNFFFAVFTLVTIIISSVCNAQIKPSYLNNNQHYTKENGLASTYILEIQEDKYGFLWIATGKGISRFDGSHFTNFTNFYENSIKYEIGFVKSIVIDESGENLWIGGDNGILYTSIDTINFVRLNALNPSISNSVGATNDLLLDKRKKLWSAGFNDGLYSFDLNGEQHKNISFVNKTQKSNSKLNSLQCLVKDLSNDDILWIGTLAGLIRFNTVSLDYQVYVYKDDPEVAQNKIRKIHVSNEEIFLGTWGEGLVVFNKQSKQFSQPLKDQFPNKHSLILDLYNDNETSMWATTRDGLIQYDLLLKRVKNVINHDMAKGLIRGISFIDSREIIWFCNEKGLFKYDPLRTQNIFIELEKRNNIQIPMQVREIILTKEFFYVLGHASSGLYKVSLTDYSFETIEIPSFEHENKGFNLRDMVVMENGNFLIVFSNKILFFNPKTQQFELPSLQIDHPHPSMQSVVRDRNNNFWIGSREGGLFCLNFEKNTIKNYKEQFNLFRDENHRWINNLYIDTKNKLWIGKGSTNIIMDLNDSSVICFNPKDKIKIKSYTDVNDYYEDNTGRVWMAGGSDGLGFSDFNNFKNGVSHNVDGYFTGVYRNNDSLLWTTGKSLGTFNINTMSYNEIKLSPGNMKLRVSGPVISCENSEFIIGCDNGFLIYNTEKQKINQEIPIPYIRKIESDGKTSYEGNSLTKKDFSFKSGTKHLVLKISSLGFHLSDQITYKYKLEDEWQNIGANQEINLTNLSNGDYKFQIKACNNLNLCNEIPKEYNFSILAPWWASWWIYLIYLGIAILFADRFYRFQLSKRLAVAESKRLKEINRVKNTLFTNITHEFRTPLTVINGMTDSIKSDLEKNQFTDTEKSLEMIQRNSNGLLRLVNEMLDLAKLESGNMKLQLVQTNVIPFVKYLSESFHSLAQKKQINLTVYSEVDQLIMDFDSKKLSAIISNVLSNAIKFTPPEGKIIVHLNRISKRKNEFFSVKIKDNGPGISNEEIDNIFNRFYQADNSLRRQNKGTGIGLALTKEFVELMGGTVEVKSAEEKGCTFIINIPVNNMAVLVKENMAELENRIISSASFETEPVHQIKLDNNLPLVLIIEDNEDVAYYLQKCLIGKYETLHAKNGIEGIEIAFKKIPDIIISDVMMPGKDGFEVCNTLKSDELTDHIPIVMLTAKATIKDRLLGLSYGADAYLAKPFVKAELFTRLDQLILSRTKMRRKFEDGGLGKFLEKRIENHETKFLQKVIKIIHENIGEHAFGASQLAYKLSLSESQIYRKLKAISGKSTAVFIRSIRLQKGKELIQTTENTISEIAYEVGFNDPSWFSRAFKEEFGFAPSAMSK